MSKPDKAATRATHKAQNHALFVPKPEHKPDSWWCVAAGPDARERFIEAAKARAEHQWTGLGTFKST